MVVGSEGVEDLVREGVLSTEPVVFPQQILLGGPGGRLVYARIRGIGSDSTSARAGAAWRLAIALLKRGEELAG